MQKDLNTLLERNIEAEQGYTFAKEHIENKNFKNFLATYARQRKKYAQEIKDMMYKNGYEPKERTSILGSIHKALMKARISGSSDRAIMVECARGESMALADYNKVLKSTKLNQEMLNIIMRHRDKIMAAEQTIRKLGKVISRYPMENS